MKHVFIAGATGYLGRFLCAEYHRRGWNVTALVRKSSNSKGLVANQLVEAEATWPESLCGHMAGVDLVISALGITRQVDGLGYWDVDYQANLNLLEEAQRSGVTRFAYVHVLNADRMDHVPLVAAKSAFVRKLQSATIASSIIAPTGYFSDMSEFLNMAQKGRVWLFGSGMFRINPIHGADLAAAMYEAIDAGKDWADIGGPDTFTQNEVADLCFDVLGTKNRVTRMPDVFRRAALWALPRLAPRRIAGPAQFFLTASAMNMTASPTGSHHLKDHFRSLVQDDLNKNSQGNIK